MATDTPIEPSRPGNTPKQSTNPGMDAGLPGQAAAANARFRENTEAKTRHRDEQAAQQKTTQSRADAVGNKPQQSSEPKVAADKQARITERAQQIRGEWKGQAQEQTQQRAPEGKSANQQPAQSPEAKAAVDKQARIEARAQQMRDQWKDQAREHTQQRSH